MHRCRITVLKRMANHDLIQEYMGEEYKARNLAPCPNLTDGQEFTAESGSRTRRRTCGGRTMSVFKTALAVMVVLILATGCAGATLPPAPQLPSPTSMPPTGMPSSTGTPIPPTVTPLLALPTATPTPPPMPAGQPVSFTAEDGVKLAGTLFPAKGDTGVVLAHMGITDQKSWQSFAGYIAGRGYTALTFDFRCYGLSDCGKMGQSESLFAQDTRAAIRFLRARGIKRIACMGASMGGTACMNAALNEELVGMVVIASPAPLYMGKEYPKDLVNPEMTKLFIVTEKDRFAQVVPAIYSLYDRSPEPKKLGIFPGTVHGTELFSTQSGPEFRDLLTRFMEELATPVAKSTATPAPTQAPPASRPPGQMLYKDSFESGISQWHQRVGTVNHTTSQYHTAPGAAKMTTAKPDGSGGYSGTSGHCIDLGSELGILPGAGSQKDVTFEAYLKSDESIMAANLGVYFHTAKGCKGTFTTDTSPAGIGKGQDWTLVSSAGAIPDTTRSIDIVVHAVGVNSSAAVYIDDIQVYLSGGDPAKP